MRTALALLLAPLAVAQESRLDTPVNLSFEEAGAPDVLAVLADVSGLDIRIAPSVGALTADELSRSVHLEQVPARIALECVLDPNLEAEIRPDHVEIRARRAEGGMATVRYEIADLLPLLDEPARGAPADVIAYWIEDSIAPGAWDIRSIVANDPYLIVRQEGRIQLAVERFLDDLRRAASRRVSVEWTVRRDSAILARGLTVAPIGCFRSLANSTLAATGRDQGEAIEAAQAEVLVFDLEPDGPLWLRYWLELARPVGPTLSRNQSACGLLPIAGSSPVVIELGDSTTAEFRIERLQSPPNPIDPDVARIEKTRQRLRDIHFPVEIQEASFDDVIALLRRESRCAVHVSPLVRWNTSVESTTFTYHSSSTDALALLDQLASTLPVETVVRPGLLLVTADREPADMLVARIHDVASFSALAWRGSGKAGPGTILNDRDRELEGLFDDEEGPGCTFWARPAAEDLVSGIIDPPEWGAEDRSMSTRGERLHVWAPRDVQDRIESLLRSSRPRLDPALTLRLETRLLSPEDLDRLPGSVHASGDLRGLHDPGASITVHLVPGQRASASLVDTHRPDPGSGDAFTTGLSADLRFASLRDGWIRLGLDVLSARPCAREDAAFSTGQVQVAVDLTPGQSLLVPTGTAPEPDGRLEYLIVDVEEPAAPLERSRDD